jgi:hypothetical protein
VSSYLTASATVQADSSRLPSEVAYIRSHLESCGIRGGQNGGGEMFSEDFGSLCQLSFIVQV